MNITINKNIKALRRGKNLTQEQLAQKLNISPQAVSKWETGTTLPDISLLPSISVVLGVTIDELFTMTDEARFERIDNMLYDVRRLSDTEFKQCEFFLIEKYNNDITRPKAALMLAQLYNKRADEYHNLASPLARRALLDNPDSKDAHNALFDSEGGAYQDWNFVNHFKLIAFYKNFLKLHPDNFTAYLWLSDLLIADKRCNEAREVAKKLKELKDSYHYELLMSNIAGAQGNEDEAQEWLERMLKRPESWEIYFAYANEMAKKCRYDKALEYFEKERPLRKYPRFVDTEEAMAQIYEIRGEYQKAIEMQMEILNIMKSDWKELEGEGIDSHLREIERLKHLMK